MLSHYVHAALRSIRSQRGIDLINVLGLAVGVASCILIVLFVADELAYDRHQPDADRIARLTRTSSALSAGPMAPALEREMPGIRRAARLDYEDGVTLEIVRGDAFQERLFFADSTLFDIFQFDVVAGDPRAALADPRGLVVTRSGARRLFGDLDPMGQTLSIGQDDESIALTVAAVLEDVPRRSHFRFDAVASFLLVEAASSRMENWSTNWLYTYVRLEDGVDAGSVESRLPTFFERHTGEAWAHFRIQPLLDIHLRSDLGYEIEPQGSIAAVYAFSAIALLVLLIACINFVNLTTARSTRRAREVGMRKVLGARRSQLVAQFIGEAVVLAALSVGLSLVLVGLVLPSFNDLAQKELALSSMATGTVVAIVVAGTLLLGLLAGSYPAFVLSSFRPLGTLQGGSVGPAGSGRFRQALVIFQFAVTCALIVSTLIVGRQLAFVRSAGLGFDAEQVVVVNMDDTDLANRFEALRDEILRDRRVVSVAAGANVPGHEVSDYYYRPEGLGGELDDLPAWDTYYVSSGYIETLDMSVVDGRAFDSARGDVESAFILNQSAVDAARELVGDAWAEPVGRQLDFYTPGREGWSVRTSAPVIGVVEDFHYRSLHERIGPLVMQVVPRLSDRLFVRLRTSDVPGALSDLERTVAAFAPERPFDYEFLDGYFDGLYRADERVGTLFGVFALLAVVIACMGLFGLAAFMAGRRVREIGVRRVFGASVTGIVAMLAGRFLRLVLIASVLGMPLAWLVMARWLEGFAYRITPGPGLFAAAAGLTMAIALLTVSYQSVRAALANPSSSLRHE